MLFLLLSIISSTSIYLILRSFKTFNIKTFPAIVINYAFAGTIGWVYAGIMPGWWIFQTDWFFFAFGVGILFISIFYLMAVTSQKYGVSVTSVASKMSLIIPVLFLVIINQDENLNFLKSLAILLAFAGVVLTSTRKKDLENNLPVSYLPFIVFLGSGLLDVFLAHTENQYLNTQEEIAVFTATGFSLAFVIGFFILIFQVFRNKYPGKREFYGGAVLGAVNYGSIFFLLLAYQSQILQQSSILPINNMGIVALSAVLGLIIFAEKMTFRKGWGIVLSLLSIALLTIV